MNYTHGELQGPTYVYYPSGKVFEKISYADNLKHDTTFRYFENGKISAIELYNHGVKQGEWNYFNSKGKKYISLNYYNNIVQGPFITYFKNGKKNSEGYFMNDVLNGELFIYHTNEKIAYHTKFKKGEIISDELHYNKKGKLYLPIESDCKE